MFDDWTNEQVRTVLKLHYAEASICDVTRTLGYYVKYFEHWFEGNDNDNVKKLVGRWLLKQGYQHDSSDFALFVALLVKVKLIIYLDIDVSLENLIPLLEREQKDILIVTCYPVPSNVPWLFNFPSSLEDTLSCHSMLFSEEKVMIFTGKPRKFDLDHPHQILPPSPSLGMGIIQSEYACYISFTRPGLEIVASGNKTIQGLTILYIHRPDLRPLLSIILNIE